MKKPFLPATLLLSILALSAMGARGVTRIQTTSFTPAPQTGDVFTVINADRSAGATTTQISVASGPAQRSVNHGNPSGDCAGVIAGWVLLVRQTRPESQPLTISTTGTIVRSPYQGLPPPEASHSCYRVERMRVQ